MSGGLALAVAPMGRWDRAAEDSAALLRARLAGVEAERRQLLLELERLRQKAGAPPAAGAAPGLGPAGYSEPLVLAGADGREGSPDPERFVLIVSFEHCAPVAGITVNSESIVAAAAWDGHVPFFDLPHWHDLGRLDIAGDGGAGPAEEEAFVAAAFIPNAPRFLGLAAGQGVQLWRQERGQSTRVAALSHGAPVSSLDFHALQALLGSAGDDGRVLLWDAQSQQLLRTLPLGSAELSACRFPGGSGFYEYLVAASGLDGNVHVWDIRRPSEVRRMRGTDAGMCLTSHPGSHLLAVGSLDGLVSTWDSRTWSVWNRLDVRSQLGSQRAHPRSLAASPCGAFLAAGCEDGELLIFDLQRQSYMFRVLHHSDAVTGLAWGGRTDWVDAPHFVACASLDGSWSCWAHSRSAVPGEY